MNITDIRRKNGIIQSVKKKYFENINNGDFTYQVDEWDQIGLDIDRETIKQIEGEIIMANRKITVRLTKANNTVETVVSDIDTIDDFIKEAQWAKSETVKMINKLPNEGFGKAKERTVKQVTKETKKVKPNAKIAKTDDRFKREDIVWVGEFGSVKQVNLFIKALNKDKIKLKDVNEIKDYDAMQVFLKTKLWAK